MMAWAEDPAPIRLGNHLSSAGSCSPDLCRAPVRRRQAAASQPASLGDESSTSSQARPATGPTPRRRRGPRRRGRHPPSPQRARHPFSPRPVSRLIRTKPGPAAAAALGRRMASSSLEEFPVTSCVRFRDSDPQCSGPRVSASSACLSCAPVHRVSLGQTWTSLRFAGALKSDRAATPYSPATAARDAALRPVEAR